VKEQRNPLGAKFGRRGAIQTGLAAAAAAPGLLGATRAASAQDATPPAAAEGANDGTYVPSGYPAMNLGTPRDSILPLQMSEELVVTTPQPVYVLPRDHKFHSGEFYATNDYWEWHYWSGFGTDEEGNEYALFFGTDPVGYDPATGLHGFMPAIASISPIAEGVKYFKVGNFTDIVAQLPEDSTSPADFQYLLTSPTDGWMVDERYYAMEERWTFKLENPAAAPEDLFFDLEIFTENPGYVPRTPTGIEDEGFNYDGSYNPQTMAGLSYYYVAPKQPFRGTVRFNGKEIQIKGRVWLEHQWGNIKVPQGQENCSWRWFSFRFNDGTDLAFRHWIIPPDNLPVHNRNHFLKVNPDGTHEYGYPNRELRYTPVKAWTVEGTDQQWDMEGLVETPWGNFYMKPLVLDSVYIFPSGMTFWEGPLSLHKDNSEGEQIGLAYCEQYFQPAGGPLTMRQLLPEQDNQREKPFMGLTPGATPAVME
jgi:hypothetical protein